MATQHVVTILSAFSLFFILAFSANTGLASPQAAHNATNNATDEQNQNQTQPQQQQPPQQQSQPQQIQPQPQPQQPQQSPSSRPASSNTITNCNLRNLDVCLISLSVFAQTQGSVKESDIDRQCIFINETTECLANYADECMTETQSQILDIMFDGANQMQDLYCTRNTPLRNLYIKHAPCLNSIGKETKGCFKLLQSGMETITTTKERGKKIPYMCCTYHKLKNCTASVVREKCGEEPLEFMNLMMRVVLSRIPDLMCPPEEYTPESPVCLEIPTSPPKVSKSTSLLNKLLSAYSSF